ncbi:MAG: DUF4878 domain-containing protein [Flavobacteriales bacterium]|nr:DUF4878 domain-containing protein [Flavobacteriales bacterium]
MKFPVVLSIAFAALMTACGGGGSTPSQVAEKFLTHTNKLEFKEAKAYATKSTGDMLDMIAGMAGMMGDKNEAKSFKITGETIDGDKATVTYRSEDKDADESLSLVKEDGKWLVNMSKEDMNKEDGAGAGDMDMDMGLDMDLEGDTILEETSTEAAQ